MLNKEMILKPSRIVLSVLFGLFIAVYQFTGKTVAQYSDDTSVVFAIKDRLPYILFVFSLSAVLAWSLFLLLDIVLPVVRRRRGSAKKTSREPRKFSQKLLLFGIFLICWVPYILIFYPGVNTMDTARQIAMAFHLPTQVAGQVCTDGIEVFYSAHHPLMLTFVFGFFVKLGALFGNANIGVFLYTMIQACCFSAVFVWVTGLIREYGAPKWLYICADVIIALSPLTGMYVINMFSDGVFSLACLIVSGVLVRVVYSDGACFRKASFVIKFIAAILLLCSAKKQGFYMFLPMMLILLLTYRKYFRQLLISLASVVLVFAVLFEGVLYSALNVSKSGVQETLSLPFQQTARYLRDADKPIPEDELEAIGKVLDVSTLADRYNADLADSVKNTFNRSSDKGDLIQYFKVWTGELLRSPSIYIDAFLEGTFRFFCVSGEMRETWSEYDEFTLERFYECYPGMVEEYHIIKEDYADADYHSPDRLASYRQKVHDTLRSVYDIPVLRVFFTVGFYFDLMIFIALYLLTAGRRREVVPLLPFLLVIAVCLLSPVNGMTRYALPVVFGMLPAVPMLFFGETEEQNERIKRSAFMSKL